MELSWYAEEYAFKVHCQLHLNESLLSLTHHLTELLYILECTFDFIIEVVALFMYIILFKTFGNSYIFSTHKLPLFIKIYVTTSSDGFVLSKLRK